MSNSNWFHDLFVKEAKSALSKNDSSGGSDAGAKIYNLADAAGGGGVASWYDPVTNTASTQLTEEEAIAVYKDFTFGNAKIVIRQASTLSSGGTLSFGIANSVTLASANSDGSMVAIMICYYTDTNRSSMRLYNSSIEYSKLKP